MSSLNPIGSKVFETRQLPDSLEKRELAVEQQVAISVLSSSSLDKTLCLDRKRFFATPEIKYRLLSQLKFDQGKLIFPSLTHNVSSASSEEVDVMALCKQMPPLSSSYFERRFLIAEKLLIGLSYEDGDRLKSFQDLVKDCGDPESVTLLFELLDYLGLESVQEQYFEPFNKVFPHIALDKAPLTIRSFDLGSFKEITPDILEFFLKSQHPLISGQLILKKLSRAVPSLPESYPEVDLVLDSKMKVRFWNRLEKNDQTFFQPLLAMDEEEEEVKLELTLLSQGFPLDSYEEVGKRVELARKLFNLLGSEEADFDKDLKKLINDCYDKRTVKLLFQLLHFYGLENFQRKHFEPFNTVFPKIPLKDAPETLSFLDFSFSKTPLSSKDFNALSKKYLKEIKLSRDQCVTDFDFSTCEALCKLDFSTTLTAQQFNSLPKNALKQVRFHYQQDFTDFNFSDCVHVTTWNFSRVVNPLTPAQFHEIPKENITTIRFSKRFPLQLFDFSDCHSVKEWDFSWLEEMNAQEFNAIPKDNAEHFHFPRGIIDVTGFDFSRCIKMKSWHFSNVTGLTAQQFNTLPKGFLSELSFSKEQRFNGFVFSDCEKVTFWNFSLTRHFTPEDFRRIPKQNIQRIDLPGSVSVGEWNLSQCQQLRCISAVNAPQMTSGEFKALPKAYLERIVFCNGQKYEQFDFSDCVHIRYLDLSSSITAQQFNDIPKQSLQMIRLYSRQNLEGFDFSNCHSITYWDFCSSELTVEQFNQMPKQSLMQITFSNIQNLKGFDFSQTHYSVHKGGKKLR